ncbi:hypothetical protein HW555_012669 [Spodoptera exigua]|uniref:Transcription factor BTF3 n=1 Tax=Spodoptera exigua TaxID=7107 RepID=A0A835G4Q3_SPOEX|nr:hypothetical protein HW555_012669 [Spodoptera exigua]
MNTEKLKKLQSQVRIGGKGTPRRKKKVVHVTAATDDKKLQSSLKKLSVNTIPGIEEVNMIKDDGTLGPEGLNQLKRLASSVAAPKPLDEDDEVPNLVGNFDDASKQEAKEVITNEKEKEKEKKPESETKAADKKSD